MNTSINAGNSIETMTVQSLDASLDGLRTLLTDSVACGQLMLADMTSGLAKFEDFVQNVRNFYVFENDISSLFQIDTAAIKDASGDLKEAEENLSGLMEDIVEKLDNQEIPKLAHLLITDLPSALDRFINLLPILRRYIQNEYLSATC
jgi:hypothetical protein